MHASFAILALVASANAYAYNYTAAPVYTTEVVSKLTTVCPGPTEITYGTHTYTVTEATTLTITDCPCTITYENHAPTSVAHIESSSAPVYTSVVPTSVAYVESGSAPVYTAVPSSAAPYPTHIPYTPANGTTIYPPVGTATSPVTTTAAPEFTGAASKAGVALLGLAGAGLAALL